MFLNEFLSLLCFILSRIQSVLSEYFVYDTSKLERSLEEFWIYFLLVTIESTNIFQSE